MSDDKHFESEEIQKGLEAFLDHEMGFDYEERERQTQISKPTKTVTTEHKKSEEDDLEIPISSPQRPKPVEKRIVTIESEEVRKRPVTPVASVSKKKKTKKKQDDYLFYDDAYDDYDDEDYDDDDYDDDYDDDDYDEDDYDDRPVRSSRNKSSRNKSSKKRPNHGSNGHKKKSKKNSKKKSGKKKHGKKGEEKKSHGLRNFLIFVAILAVIFFGVTYSFVGKVYHKMNYEKTEGLKYAPLKEDGVINVLLIGNDSRLGADDGRSDAMILISISDKTKTITMTSFLRDMYVEIPGHDGNRLNAAYAYGGPKLLMETIEQNFDIKVHRYALVNFEAFANLVDAVGGIDLDVTNEEVKLINGYLMEYNQLLGRDLTYDWLDENASGVLHLNGAQALAYTRNRYIGTDFGRTERQRKVLSEVFKKLPKAMIKNSDGVIDGLFPNLTTNLTQGECYRIALSGWKMLLYETVQQCVPKEGTYKDATIRSMMVLEVDFEANKQFLKETIYGK